MTATNKEPTQLILSQFYGSKGDIILIGLLETNMDNQPVHNLVTMCFQIVDENSLNDGVLSIRHNEAELEESLGLHLNVSTVRFFHNDITRSLSFVDVRDNENLQKFIEANPGRNNNIVEFPVCVTRHDSVRLTPEQK